jgi:GlpG protein
MRSIGKIESEANARKFADYLAVQGIGNQIEAETDGGWTVWILSDEDMDRGRDLLGAFRLNPGDARFQGATREARQLREKQEKEQRAFAKRTQKEARTFRPMAAYGPGPLTLVLIGLSGAVFAVTKGGRDMSPARLLLISDYLDGLPEVQQGQVWRLITPILVHGGLMHIFFNMWCLFDFGSMIEGRQSSWLLGLMVLVLAAGSNLAQFLWAGPSFYGMSGVIFGLFGYIWVRGRLDPGSGLFLHPQTVVVMMACFLLGWSGLMGPIANMAHGGGLLMGTAWGYLSSLRHR